MAQTENHHKEDSPPKWNGRTEDTLTLSNI